MALSRPWGRPRGRGVSVKNRRGPDSGGSGGAPGGGGSIGKRTLTGSVQRRAKDTAPVDAASTVETAERGVAGPGGALPHVDRIQESFGPGHDVSGVRAHV